MQREYKLTLIGLGALLMIRVVELMASKWLNSDFESLSTVSFLIVVVIAYKISRITDSLTTATLLGLLGFFGRLIGFIVSYLLEPNTVSLNPYFSLVLASSVGNFVLYAILGAIIWFIQSKIPKKV